MRIHRFYVGHDVELKHDFWLHDMRLLNQWRRVLRMQAGQEVLLFDGERTDRLYRITEITDKEAHLSYVTDYERQLPKRDIYLAWALLKKDKNEWVIQKATELGVSHFVPLIADRSEKLGFDTERMHKIAIEAAEQCGRSDIPVVRDPMHVSTFLDESKDQIDIYICEQSTDEPVLSDDNSSCVMIGPEGGWSDAERQLFADHNLKHIQLNDLTLRAETAAVVAAATVMR